MVRLSNLPEITVNGQARIEPRQDGSRACPPPEPVLLTTKLFPPMWERSYVVQSLFSRDPSALICCHSENRQQLKQGKGIHV